MDLQRVGGAGDAGVDLQGWWYLPDSATGPPEPAARATPAKQEVMYAEHVKDMNHPWNGFYDSPEHFAQTVRGRVSTIMQCFPKPFHGTYSEAVEASRSPMTTTKMGCATYGAGEDERNEIYELYRGVWQLRWLDQISGDTAARHEEGTREQDLHSPDALPHRLRVVAQCKAESKPLGPVKLRELEGTLGRITQNAKTSGAHSASSEAAPVGVLISLEGFSKQTINQTMSSSFPILLLHLQRGMACSTSSSPTDSRSPSPNLGARGIAQANSSSRASVEELRNASMSSIMMNQALSGSKGPLGGRLDVRWTHRLQSNYSPSSVRGKLASPPLPTGSTRRPALFWDGKLLGKRGRERQVER
ncbi:Protein of unknown function DUF2034 [Ceraceosorus bombacis]|uniref:Restriction endonuclease type IV Mrr domain-containing protein n=1 Tax=Ceraceosorus bombacis TaxID=401625 RepID=A0A0P1BJY8_9BASI|nr:Protein of unknown function DUF2034 [Ceraceosorus bombacis]